MPRYLFSLKSKEQRGATDPNTVDVILTDAGDLDTFKDNLELMFDATVVSVNEVQETDYSLPYPAGTGNTFRGTARDSVGRVYTFYIPDVEEDMSVAGFKDALIAAGAKLPDYDTAIVSLVGMVFPSSPSA